MGGRPNKIHLRVKWSCSWATGLQPLYFWFIGNTILNVISPTRLGSMREYAKYFFFFSESPEPNIIQRPTLWSKGWITLICTATRQEMLSFLNISKWLSSMYVHIYASCCWAVFSCVWLFATPWTVACQAPLFMRFPRQEYCSGLPFPTIVFMHTCLKIIISSELALNIRIISVVL